MHQKEGIILSLYNFLFGNANSAKDIKTIKNKMEILKQNHYILNSQIQKTFNFINLTYAEIFTVGHFTDK